MREKGVGADIGRKRAVWGGTGKFLVAVLVFLFTNELARGQNTNIAYVDPASSPPLGLTVRRSQPVVAHDGKYVQICHPQIIERNGTLYMTLVLYYSDPARPRDKHVRSDIGLATSQNGIHWRRREKNGVFDPILRPSETGWDDGRVGYHSIVKVRDEYWMYYSAFSQEDWRWRSIGLAKSLDLIHWEKWKENPVLVPPPGHSYLEPLVFREAGKFFLFFMDRVVATSKAEIDMATSDDGLNWRVQPEPVIRRKYVWEGFDIAPQSILKHGDRYYLFFTTSRYGEDPVHYRGACVADSRDLLRWERVEGYDYPNIPYGKKDADWIHYFIDHCYLLPFNDRYLLYFSGGGPDLRPQEIGLAELVKKPRTALELCFDDRDGPRTADWSEQKAAAKLVGDARWLSGEGSGVSLNGAGYLKVDSSPCLEIAGSFALEVQIRPRRLRSSQVILWKENSEADGHPNYELSLSQDGHLVASAYDGEMKLYECRSADSIPLDRWNDIQVICDGRSRNLAFLINGKPSGKYPIASGPVDACPAFPLFIGIASKCGNPVISMAFHGDVRFVRIKLAAR